MERTDELVFDYTCKSVGEALAKYRLPPDWIAEFDVMDCVCPVVAISVELLAANPMALALRLSEIPDPDKEFPACVLDTQRQTICFKIGTMHALTTAFAAYSAQSETDPAAPSA